MYVPTLGLLGRAKAKVSFEPRQGARIETLAPPQMAVRLINDLDALAENVPDWDDLASEALEPNPFYESWMLRPALHAFGQGQRIEFALVYHTDPHQTAKAPRLCGLFPLERQTLYKGLPASVLRLWRYNHCFLCTPLLRASHARATFDAFLHWARCDSRGAALVEFRDVPADGPFQNLLIDYLNDRHSSYFVVDIYNRALLRTRENAEAFLAAALSRGYRKETRRLRRRLDERGRLESRILRSEDELERWIDQFLQLEASGWKGHRGTGTAIKLHENESIYCREIWREARRRGRLQMAGLFLDDRPIAMSINYLVGDGGFRFKIGHDESFARFSPGVQLELDLIRLAHDNDTGKLQWLDSCAVPKHPMINRLWPDRRPIQTVLLSTGRWLGELAVLLLPLLRWTKRVLFRFAGIAGPHQSPLKGKRACTPRG